jgi:two-component system, chemotaxis family, protein-glutamate methylesterase/glutaminase
LEHRDIVVIGASAGGLAAISKILKAMPHDVDAAILIVLHTANRARSFLPQILERAGKLPILRMGKLSNGDECTSLPRDST